MTTDLIMRVNVRTTTNNNSTITNTFAKEGRDTSIVCLSWTLTHLSSSARPQPRVDLKKKWRVRSYKVVHGRNADAFFALRSDGSRVLLRY